MLIYCNIKLKFFLNPFLFKSKTWKTFVLNVIWHLFVIFATDFSLVLLIKGGALSGTDTYQSLVNKTFGFPGYLLLSVLQFLYPFIGKMNVKMHIILISINILPFLNKIVLIVIASSLKSTSCWDIFQIKYLLL